MNWSRRWPGNEARELYSSVSMFMINRNIIPMATSWIYCSSLSFHLFFPRLNFLWKKKLLTWICGGVITLIESSCWNQQKQLPHNTSFIYRLLFRDETHTRDWEWGTNPQTHGTGSLVPRLLHSGTRNWTCARGESLVFFLTWSTAKGRTTLIVRGHTRRLRTGKRAKVAANLLHVSSYRGLNIIHTERWTHSSLNNAQNDAFLI